MRNLNAGLAARHGARNMDAPGPGCKLPTAPRARRLLRARPDKTSAQPPLDPPWGFPYGQVSARSPSQMPSQY